MRKRISCDFISPNGEIVIVDHIMEFCSKNNLSYKHMYAVASGKEKSHKGWKKADISWIERQTNNQSARKYEINHNFFDEDNEASFYWAGFLAADGNVSGRDNCVKLSLAIKDVGHLEKFRDALRSNTPFYYYNKGKTKAGDRDMEMVSLSIFSSQIKETLKKFNIVPNKTLIYTMPDWLIEHPLVHHFMRGYVDGDGCFWINEKKKECNFEILGTQKFLEVFQQIFIEKLNFEKVKIESRVNNKALKLRYGGNKQTNKIFDFLYKDATVYLERKFEIANKAKEFSIIRREHRNKLEYENSTEYEFISPHGDLVKIKSLPTFCKENGLFNANMYAVAHGKRYSHHGWRKA